ncbi:MAG: hypothetical protein KatS3mg100_167 [Candidatus Parcubacteria bacterium]|nr:MAG: hypothetical protein KatS3mg100_167 [Candidatus Parcubacteria bacterium]
MDKFMDKFEVKRSFPEKKAEEWKEGEIDIPDEVRQTLEIIAKRVGGDFGMKIQLGEPGGGSFFDPEDLFATFEETSKGVDRKQDLAFSAAYPVHPSHRKRNGNQPRSAKWGGKEGG